MLEKDNKPEIRFKGFTDDWKQYELGDIADFSRGKGLCWNDIVSDGTHECVLYGHLYTDYGMVINNVNYSTNKYSNEMVLSHFGDVLIPCSDTTPTGLARATSIEKSGVILGGDINILRPKQPLIGSFLSYNINSNRNKLIKLIKGTTVRHLDNSDLKNVEIYIPQNPNEQGKVSEALKSLDHFITLHQFKYDKLVNVKKSMLEKMFPKNGADVPEIRFDGFSDAWEQHKLGDLMEITSASRVHKDEWVDAGVPFYRSSDVVAEFKGVDNSKAYISIELYEELVRKSGCVQKDDVLVTGGGSIGIPYLVRNNAPLYFKDADLIWLKNGGCVNGQFLYTFFTTSSFRHYVNSITHIGTISHYTIEQAKSTPICLPGKEEQNKIGEFFKKLNHLIALHQREIEKLKNIKKACLEKMFV